jgi:hypothetical protein
MVKQVTFAPGQRTKTMHQNQNNAPAHNVLSVKQFLANKYITVLEQPLYSPDLDHCVFYLFSKLSR